VNIVELPTLMRQHSEQVPGPVLPESRIAGVTRKVGAARRRRTAAGIAGVAAIVAVIPFIAGSGGRAVQPAATSTAATTINGFPEYAIGGHLVATDTAPLNKPISLTITPADLGLAFSDRCSVADQGLDVEITMALPGGNGLMVGCGAGGGAYASQDSLAAAGLTPGVPASVTFSAKAYRVTTGANGEQTGRTPVALPAGTYSVGVWQKLPFDRYPLPPRPKTLPALHIGEYDVGDAPHIMTVHSDPTNPLTPQTISFTMPTCAKVATSCNATAATSQTPGVLHIAVNGVEVNTAEFWDYTGGGSMFDIESGLPNGPNLRPGELVTITITPQYVTGAWEFAVAPGSQR